MSEANLPAIYGPYRRKVTLACGSCRKRRVKCSGNHPCTLCSESGRVCEFNNNRGRRGPRPRRPATEPERTIRQLAPRQPSPEQEELSTAVVAIDQTWMPQGLQAAEEAERQASDDEDDGDDGGYHNENGQHEQGIPDPTLWKTALEELIYGDDSISNRLPALDVHLICHLLEIFCTRSSAQLRLLLSPTHIQHHLSQGTLSRDLVLAVCASSVRLTVHKAARGPHAKHLADSIAREARNSMGVSTACWRQVNTVKALCVLVDYEASRAHGRQAWVDIAMGRSLVQLAQSNVDLEPEQTQALSVAERYLAIAQVSHCLGHPRLQPPCVRSLKRPNLETQGALCPADSPHLEELLEALVRISHLCSTPFKKHDPPPWTAGSNFRALQDELEEYLLRHPGTFHFGPDSSPEQPEQRDPDAAIASLIWHCCVIVLNRTFLPIPERQTPTAVGQEPEVRCVQFPGAPLLFLKERAYRCESSADAICEITRDVIKSGGFHSNALLVGFACTQSALVCINRLHRSSKPHSDRIAENLKIAFITVGALKSFYSSAEAWIEMLFQARNANARLRHESETIESAFSSFFSRFIDIEEPVFMPLDPTDRQADDAEENDGPGRAAEARDGTVAENHEQGQDTTSDAPPAWLQAYAGHLSEGMQVDDDLHAADETSRSPAIPTGVVQTHGELPMPSRADQQPQGRMSMEIHDPDSPVQMAGAILTSMSGGTPNQSIQPQGIPLGYSQEDTRGSITVDVNDAFSGLFGQMPPFGDMLGVSPEMPIFPGLGPDISGPDIWSDIFNHDMLK